MEDSIVFLRKLNQKIKVNLSDSIIVRTDGLLGDNIIASTSFQGIRKTEKKKSLVIYSTYHHDPERVRLLCDLFQELIKSQVIKCILHYGRGHGDLNNEEKDFFRQIGCYRFYDCAPWSNEFYSLKLSGPMLGNQIQKIWNSRDTETRNVAIFRHSNFHLHYQQRNRPWGEWRIIEEFLLKNEFRVVLFGWDDFMPCSSGIIDYRRKLGIHKTLEILSQCRFLVSTVTFVPLYCQFFVPCFVLSDPSDIDNLVHRWRVLKNYKIYDVSNDYLTVLCNDLDKMINYLN